MMNNTMNNANLNNLDMNEFAKLVAKSMLDMANEAPVPVTENPKTEHGKYFGKTICGEVYNPRTTRRWISAQFLKLMKYTDRYTSINQVINNWYTYKYSILYTCKEAKLLAHLEKNDPVAFEERKHFFDRTSIREIFTNFAEEFQPSIVKLVKSTWSYADLAKIAETIEFVIAKKSFECAETVTNPKSYFKNHKLDKAFIACFKKSGAYYTLKNYIMFDDAFVLCWFDERFIRENALKKLRVEIESPDYYFYKALEVSITKNGISLYSPFDNMRN